MSRVRILKAYLLFCKHFCINPSTNHFNNIIFGNPSLKENKIIGKIEMFHKYFN